jgi:hypothetical protein
MAENKVDGRVEIPGHEKTIGKLQVIVSEYREKCF